MHGHRFRRRAPGEGALAARHLSVRTVDHPEAGGRTPAEGEAAYVFGFRLADGRLLRVEMGPETYAEFRGFVLAIDIHDFADRAQREGGA